MLAKLNKESRKRKLPNGRTKPVTVYRVCWRDENKNRPSIYLGTSLNKSDAEKFRRIVSDLLSCKAIGDSPAPELQKQIESLHLDLYQKLVDKGLVVKRSNTTVSELFREYLAQQKYEPRTTSEWESLRTNCVGSFGSEKRIRLLRRSDFEGFVRTLKKRYRPATIEKRIKNLKQLFRFAKSQGLISTNHVQQLKFRISKEDKVADKEQITKDRFENAVRTLPDEEWACFLAFHRWLGCRKVEPFEDRWEHIDFENSRIRRWDNKKKRRIDAVIPFELVPFIVALRESSFDSDELPSGYIFPNVRKHSNPHKRVTDCMKRGGQQPWAEFFNALRASRSRELIRISPALESHLIGHGAEIAALHYDAPIEADYKRIVGVGFPAFDGRIPEDQSVQESVQQEAASRSTTKPIKKAAKGNAVFPVAALLCSDWQSHSVPPRGVLTSDKNAGKRQVMEGECAAECAGDEKDWLLSVLLSLLDDKQINQLRQLLDQR